MFDPWTCSSGLWTRHSGGINFRFPVPSMINLTDIADSLARQCRWNGHVPVSVAEHCMLLADYVDPDLEDHALLHDAAEAYLGDIPTPLKRTLVLAGEPFHVVEERMLRCIFEALNVEYSADKIQAVLDAERKLLKFELDVDPDREIRSRTNALHWERRVRKCCSIT